MMKKKTENDHEAVLRLLTTKFKFASVSEIASDLGWSESRVRKTLADIKKMGLADEVSASFLAKGGGGVSEILGLKTEDIIKKLGPRTKLHYSLVTPEHLEEIHTNVERHVKSKRGKPC